MHIKDQNLAFQKPYGTVIKDDGKIEFNLWAPDVDKVILVLAINPDQIVEFPMDSIGDGWYQLLSDVAKVGMDYQFKLDNGLCVPDPASRFQPNDVHGPSKIIDPNKFDWSEDSNWEGFPWEKIVIYEIHTGTFTPEGTFKAIENKLDYLLDLGITAIELMPVADFPGAYGWGYDGVALFAPDSCYGTPDDLKNLILAAHKKGLMVFIDVVYNHFGPEGNYLYVYAKSQFFNKKIKTPWGDAINFSNKNVREFFISNALYWLNEYRFDGIRFDAIHAIYDDIKPNIIEEIGARVRSGPGKYRKIHLMLENDSNESFYIKKDRIDDQRYFDAQWNDDAHHTLHILMTGEKTGYYSDYTQEVTGKPTSYYLARSLSEGFAYQGEMSQYRDNLLRGQSSKNIHSSGFVSFIQNHDQVGNRAFGERISEISHHELLRAGICLNLIAPWTPMLFMGEEWASQNPFLFFCNFGEDLADSVRRGRQEEFSRFPQFNDPELLEKIPDPNSLDSFNKSKLDWDNLQCGKHKELFDFYLMLLKKRKEFIVPLLVCTLKETSIFEVLSDHSFIVEWEFNKSERSKLKLLANFADEYITYEKDLPQNLLVESRRGVSNDLTNIQKLGPNSVCWYLD